MTVSGDVSLPSYLKSRRGVELYCIGADRSQIKNLDANAERGFHVQ